MLNSLKSRVEHVKFPNKMTHFDWLNYHFKREISQLVWSWDYVLIRNSWFCCFYQQKWILCAQEDKRRKKSANRFKHWTAGNRIKIRRYFCINLPLKDGGGLWHPNSKRNQSLNFLEILGAVLRDLIPGEIKLKLEKMRFQFKIFLSVSLERFLIVFIVKCNTYHLFKRKRNNSEGLGFFNSNTERSFEIDT